MSGNVTNGGQAMIATPHDGYLGVYSGRCAVARVIGVINFKRFHWLTTRSPYQKISQNLHYQVV